MTFLLLLLLHAGSGHPSLLCSSLTPTRPGCFPPPPPPGAPGAPGGPGCRRSPGALGGRPRARAAGPRRARARARCSKRASSGSSSSSRPGAAVPAVPVVPVAGAVAGLLLGWAGRGGGRGCSSSSAASPPPPRLASPPPERSKKVNHSRTCQQRISLSAVRKAMRALPTQPRSSRPDASCRGVARGAGASRGVSLLGQPRPNPAPPGSLYCLGYARPSSLWEAMLCREISYTQDFRLQVCNFFFFAD